MIKKADKIFEMVNYARTEGFVYEKEGKNHIYNGSIAAFFCGDNRKARGIVRRP